MNRRTLLRAAAGVGCCGVAGCHYGPTYRYRYKLTLAVRAEGRLYRGANVVECGAFAPKRGRHGSLPGETVQGFTHGEAVLDIGRGRLVGSPTVTAPAARPSQTGTTTIPRPCWSGPMTSPRPAASTSPALIPHAPCWPSSADPARSVRRSADAGHLPDAKDPSTATQLNPDDLAATFGPGIKLEPETLEVSEDHITRGAVRKRLPWVSALMPLRMLHILRAHTPSFRHP